MLEDPESAVYSNQRAAEVVLTFLRDDREQFLEEILEDSKKQTEDFKAKE